MIKQLQIEKDFLLHTISHNSIEEESKLKSLLISNHMKYLLVFNTFTFLLNKSFSLSRNSFPIRLFSHLFTSVLSIFVCSHFNYRLIHSFVLFSDLSVHYFILKSKSELFGKVVDSIENKE